MYVELNLLYMKRLEKGDKRREEDGGRR